MKFLILSVPYEAKFDGDITDDDDNNSIITNFDWVNVKQQYGDHIIDMITEKYIPNLKKITLKSVVFSPADFERRPTTSVYGTLSCGAVPLTLWTLSI